MTQAIQNRGRFVQLTEQEYIVFCDLLISGNYMADYLSAASRTPHSLADHARYWRQLAKHFKPLLNE